MQRTDTSAALMESYQPFNPLSFSISARSKYCAIHTLLLAAVNFTGSQGQKPGGPHARGAAAKRSYPTSEVRGSGREELPSVLGQGRRLGGATPCPRSSGCTGAGGPREAIPRSRSGGVAVRRYPSSKVRSSSCTLLEQP